MSARPTKYEAERIEKMRYLGCAACAKLRRPEFRHLELHHILDGYRRLGHWFTIFLCRGHHQGDWSATQLACMPAEKRVSISDGRKLFNAIYGSEQRLWEGVQKRLKLTAAWPSSKIVPRRIA